MARRNNIADMNICEMLDVIHEEICREYCKYMAEWRIKHDEVKASDLPIGEKQVKCSELYGERLNHCRTCPITRLS